MKKLLIFLMLVFVMAIPVSASTKTAAKKAYKNYMGENGITDYALIYFDNDSVPELLVDDMGELSLFTYKNKKVTPYKNSVIERRFEVIGYYKKQGCLVQRRTTRDESTATYMTTYWTASGTAIYNKLQSYTVEETEGEVASTQYTWNKKKSTDPYMGKKTLSEKKWNQKLKKITAGKNRTKISWKTYNPQSLKINKESATIDIEETVQLKVTGTSAEVSWSTSSKSIATVSSTGKVKGKNAGVAVITAAAGGKSASCVVTVTDEGTKEYWHENGGRAEYIATMNSSYGGSISTITSKANVLTIYGGVRWPTYEDSDRVNYDYYGINKFWLSPDTQYAFENQYDQGYVSKDSFFAYYLEDFLNGDDYDFLYITVEGGVITHIAVSFFEPQG